jgi:phosphohistidine phosphatase
VIVYLVRHGQAGRADDDAERRLTEKGKQEARWVAERIAQTGAPARIICASPHLRARETSELIAAGLGATNIEVVPELAPGADVDRILDVIERRAVQGPICLVGHMPDLGELAAFFSWGERGRVINLATGGLVCAEIADCGERREFSVKWIDSPK